jgi:hypothetical protein
MDIKKCNKCGQEKSLDFYRKNKSNKDGHDCVCKSCRSDVGKKYREENQDRIKEWYSNNRERLLECKKEYRQKNIERVKELDRKYHESHKVERCEYSKEYRRLNKEKIKAYYVANKDKIVLKNKKWRKENPETFKRLKLNRTARKQTLPNTLTDEQLNEIMNHFGHSCALTGVKDVIQLDHVIPLSIGHGGTIKGNIVPLESKLNKSKNASNIFEWFNQNSERLSLDEIKFNGMVNYLAECNDMTVDQYREYVDWCFANPNIIEVN